MTFKRLSDTPQIRNQKRNRERLIKGVWGIHLEDGD